MGNGVLLTLFLNELFLHPRWRGVRVLQAKITEEIVISRLREP